MLPSIAQLAAKHQIRPLKKYGQNFLFDESLCDKIVRVANITDSDNVLEIGPGPAGLTRSILKAQPNLLTVVELDERCMPLLNEIKFHYPNLNIKKFDALKIKLAGIANQIDDLGAQTINQKIKIISNLPYNIGTKLLINWLHEIENVESMTIMLQKEVAQRIVAKPGCKEYGRLSIISQIISKPKIAFDVSPKAFYPAPKVWSSIIHITPKESKDIPDRELLRKLEQITNLAFSGRRKKIKSSLKSLEKLFPKNPDIVLLLEQAGISQDVRAEEITTLQYMNLAKLI
jgi:16S rRNA (adenine1518-N6/adenine1519-N6)-dimethyltransferase